MSLRRRVVWTRLPLMDREAIGPYRIVRPLGKGGMGQVFEALHQQIGRRAAIKILHANLATDSEYLQRFLNEAVAVNSVDHPGIVEIYDFGTLEDGTTFLVMEFIEGETLSQRLAALGGKLPPSDAVWIGKEVAIAVAAAHAKGIVHRDLKPDNVMLSRDKESARRERVKLLDFGIAKLSARSDAAAQTQVGAVMGTLWYISPEQLRNTSQVTDRADVFSLGALLYHLISGRPPIRAGSEYELIAHYITDQKISPLVEVAPQTPLAVADLVMRMLSTDAGQRPAMIDVAAELAHLEIELLGDEPGMVPLTLIPRSGLRPVSGPVSGAGALRPKSGSAEVLLPPSSGSTMSAAASESALSPLSPLDAKKGRARLVGLAAAIVLPALAIVLWAKTRPPAPIPIAVSPSVSVSPSPVGSSVRPLPGTGEKTSDAPVASAPSVVVVAKPDPPPSPAEPVVVARPKPSHRPVRPGCVLVNVSAACLGSVIPREVRSGVVQAAQTARLQVCQGKTVKIQRTGQRMFFSNEKRIPREQEDLFSQTLRGYLIKQNLDLPFDLELRCGT